MFVFVVFIFLWRKGKKKQIKWSSIKQIEIGIQDVMLETKTNWTLSFQRDSGGLEEDSAVACENWRKKWEQKLLFVLFSRLFNNAFSWDHTSHPKERRQKTVNVKQAKS